MTSGLAMLVVGAGFGLAKGLATTKLSDGVITAVSFGLITGVLIEVAQRGSARAGAEWTPERRRRLLGGLVLGTLVGATLFWVLLGIMDD